MSGQKKPKDPGSITKWDEALVWLSGNAPQWVKEAVQKPQKINDIWYLNIKKE